MLTIFLTIAPVFLMVAAGYGARKANMMPEGSGILLARFVTWIALPVLTFDIVVRSDWARLWDSRFAIASLGGSLVVFGIGMIIGRLRGLAVADIAIDGLNASYSNAAYVGLPLFALVIGPQSAPYVIIAATLTLMTLFACAVIAIELGHHRDQGMVHALGKAITGIATNPVMVGPVLGLLWLLSGAALPMPVATFTHLLGAAASPAALVAIGLFLAERPLRESVSNRFVLLLTTAKLLLHPLLTAGLVYGLLGMRGLPALMAVAIGALPTGTGPFMMAGFYARDGRVTSGTILVTTLISVFTLSVILNILPH